MEAVNAQASPVWTGGFGWSPGAMHGYSSLGAYYSWPHVPRVPIDALLRGNGVEMLFVDV